MGLSGLIGAGAQQGLEELLTQQLLEARQAEQVRAQQAQERQATDRLSFDRERLAADQAERASLNDDRDATRREAANRFGVEDMLNQRKVMDEQDATAALARELEALMGDPAVPAIDKRAARLRRMGVTSAPHMTPEEQRAANAADVSKAIQIARGQQQAERDFAPPEKPAPAAENAITAYSTERQARTLDAAKNLKNKVSGWTTGAGSMLSGLPATDARNFKAELQTLKANIAFNELAQMRAASKTGGALGAVSDKESALLESVLGALDQAQSPQQFSAQLDQIIGSLERFNAAQALGGVPGNGATVVPPGGKKFTILGVK